VRAGTRRALLGGLVSVAVLAGAVGAGAQTSSPAVRFAFLWEAVVAQRAARPGLAAALERGVVERPAPGAVDAIPREAVVRKPMRLLGGPEAAAFGGQGEFQLVALRPAADATAWTSVEIQPLTRRPGDVCVLEIGGEQATVAQVIGTLLVAAPDGTFVRHELALPALIRGTGIPVVLAPLVWPAVRSDAPALFRRAGSLELLIARSGVETMVDASLTPRGPADIAPMRAGEWREGDRLLVRVPLAALEAGAPGLVVGWKDRVPLSPIGEGR
jgi:hypothetical protein